MSRLTLLKTHFTSDAAKDIFEIEKSVLFELYERTFLQRTSIQAMGGNEIFVYDFHAVIRKYLQGKSSGSLTFTTHELHRYIEHYSDLIRNLYEKFRDDVLKHTRLVDLLTADRINDFYEVISGISDERKRSIMSNLLGLLLLQTGQKTKALFYHKLCYEIDSRLGELERVANDLNNIGACFSEGAYSDEALSIHIKLAKEYENEKRYKDSAEQYIGSGLIYGRKGDPQDRP
jgi:tetratricopeptide (TPR) repeat protein